VTAGGIPMIIANGNLPDVLEKLFEGEAIGTFFVPGTERMAKRKCWIGYSIKPEGSLTIDDGAVTAIVRRGKSLLPSGILEVEGDFGVGAGVQFKNLQGEVLGVGLVNYSAADIRKIKGLQTHRIAETLGEKPYDEVIHRDNLVITERCA